MADQPLTGTSAADSTVWVILAALLIAGVVVGVGGLSFIHASQQGQMPTGSQTTPTFR